MKKVNSWVAAFSVVFFGVVVFYFYIERAGRAYAANAIHLAVT
jgi:hypothetical protein